MGVGDKPPRMDLADYVLSRFSKEDREKMEQAFKDAADAVEVMITDGADEKTVHFHTGIYAQENETVIIEIE